MDTIKITMPKVDDRIRKTKRYKFEFILLYIRLILLTPLKFIYIIFSNAYKNQIVDFISIILGIGICEYFIWLLIPFNGNSAILFMLLSILNATFGIVVINKITNNVCKFFMWLFRYPNYMYNKIREIIRTEKDDYSIGLDEEARVGINQFIKKNKKEKEFTFKG